MNYKKKLLSLLTIGALSCGVWACGSSENVTDQDNGKLNVVCISFPEYDWARQVIGEENENVQLSLIVDNGMDIHNYQPSADDMIEISNSDLCIYNGGTSEEWVEEAAAGGNQVKTVNVMELLETEVVEEELVEGMQEETTHVHGKEETANAHEDVDVHSKDVHSEEKDSEAHNKEVHNEEETEHTHEEVEEHVHEAEEAEYDEHVWLSLKNAIKAVNAIQTEVSTLDEENAILYQENASAYVKELEALNQKYAIMVQESKRNVLLFGDRFPFRYLTDDYGLTYYAAFPGCSAETEASFETIVFLAEKVKENQLPCILTIDGSDQAIAQSVKTSTGDNNVKILTLNSLQSVSKEKLEETTYLSVMEENLQVIKEALD
ncbi:MAG: zinc ABC transporter substrate-binding protein [Lachnospiraceae bacterium]|nr:zinc ABC transporter substrate-binding protein [Lachnospiraceae bacterium]